MTAGEVPSNLTDLVNATASALSQNVVDWILVTSGNNTANLTTPLSIGNSTLFEFNFDNMTATNNTQDVAQTICPDAFVPPASCCSSDLVFLIDQAYFANQTNQTELLQQLFNSTRFACPDIQVAIIEYGLNASVILFFDSFSNVSNSSSGLASNSSTLESFLRNYTVGSGLGSLHNAGDAYLLALTQVSCSFPSLESYLLTFFVIGFDA